MHKANRIHGKSFLNWKTRSWKALIAAWYIMWCHLKMHAYLGAYSTCLTTTGSGGRSNRQTGRRHTKVKAYCDQQARVSRLWFWEDLSAFGSKLRVLNRLILIHITQQWNHIETTNSFTPLGSQDINVSVEYGETSNPWRLSRRYMEGTQADKWLMDVGTDSQNTRCQKNQVQGSLLASQERLILTPTSNSQKGIYKTVYYTMLWKNNPSNCRGNTLGPKQVKTVKTKTKSGVQLC